MADTFRSILITGASSGIGAALAETFAGPGVRLALVGRNAERLDAVAARCRAAGAEAVFAALDVTDAAALATFMAEQDAARPLDLVVANAGITTGMPEGAPRETSAAARALIATNLVGIVNAVEPAIDLMTPRGRGRIAVTGSVAALRGLSYSPSYCATKAAVHIYTEGWRAALRPFGVGLSLIVPGFVDTAMSGSLDSPRPLLVTAESAARIIRRGLEKGRERIIFPRALYWLNWLGARVPDWLYDAVTRHVPVRVPVWTDRP